MKKKNDVFAEEEERDVAVIMDQDSGPVPSKGAVAVALTVTSCISRVQLVWYAHPLQQRAETSAKFSDLLLTVTVLFLLVVHF